MYGGLLLASALVATRKCLFQKAEVIKKAWPPLLSTRWHKKMGKATDDHYVKKDERLFANISSPMSEFLCEHMFVHTCTYACMYYYTFLCVRNTFSLIFRMMYYICRCSNCDKNFKRAEKEDIKWLWWNKLRNTKAWSWCPCWATVPYY